MMNSMMMDNMMYDSMIIICILMGIGLIIFVVILGLTVYLVVRLLMKKIRIEDRPLMILKESYVKGEISEDEFKRKRKFIKEQKE
ncbi:SHOCT domain-containing protein [Oceanobacillus sp. 1P07AA]|uniref:SHOCT domain-containing protein n=1 Tax=Oceanobacillus sp. 1P07AA TaxID=3132293 RepID=UPI0039A5FF0A